MVVAAMAVVAGMLASPVGGLTVAEGAPAGPAVGAVADITWGTSSADVDRTVAAMTSAGVKWVRANVAWSGGEPNAKGVLNTGYLASIDYAVNRARAAGLEVLMPISDGVPYWASADPAKYQGAGGAHWNPYWRPSNFTDYADFVRIVVTRYRAMGVHTFELWNEPNLARFWPSGPNATQFVSLLAAAYPAAKAADPGATVLMGGLSKNDYTFLGQVYAAGGRPYFDAVAVHPYTGSADPTWCWNQGSTTKLAVDAFCGIEEVRRTMEANGDSAKQLWLTEFGWSTTTGAYGVSPSVQAEFLTKAFTKLQGYPYVRAAFWYGLRDTGVSAGDYEMNLGLLRRDFTEKPAMAALRGYAATDAAPPVLSGVAADPVGATTATVKWTTNEASTSVVEYWVTSPIRSVADARLVASHAVVLTGLARKTRYSYRVTSLDAAGNRSVSAASTFTTKQ